MSTTQNMGLTVPDVSVTTGPQWAQQINSDLSIIDSHNHAPGSGVQIPTAGININDDLSFNQSWSALDVKSVGFTSQASAISTALINRLYVVNGNLYYNDNAGNQIPITVSGGVAGSLGNITGLVAPASASYSPGTTTFSWQSNSNVPALMNCGPVLVRPPTVSSFGVSLESPTGLGVNQSLTLPARPASQSLITMSNGGVQTTATVNSTLTLTASSLTVANSGITATQLATACVSPIKMGSATYNKSSSTGNAYTISASTTPVSVPALSMIFSAVNTRPIVIALENDQSGVASTIGSLASWGIYVEVAGTTQVANSSFTASTYIGPGSVFGFYIPASAGVYTMSVYVSRASLGPIAITNTKLVAYQL